MSLYKEALFSKVNYDYKYSFDFGLSAYADYPPGTSMGSFDVEFKKLNNINPQYSNLDLDTAAVNLYNDSTLVYKDTFNVVASDDWVPHGSVSVPFNYFDANYIIMRLAPSSSYVYSNNRQGDYDWLAGPELNLNWLTNNTNTQIGPVALICNSKFGSNTSSLSNIIAGTNNNIFEFLKSNYDRDLYFSIGNWL